MEDKCSQHEKRYCRVLFSRLLCGMISKPVTHIPPPTRKDIAGRIRSLLIGQSILIDDAADGSVKSVVTRLKTDEFLGRRWFTCAKETGGVRVWRIPNPQNR